MYAAQASGVLGKGIPPFDMKMDLPRRISMQICQASKFCLLYTIYPVINTSGVKYTRKTVARLSIPLVVSCSDDVQHRGHRVHESAKNAGALSPQASNHFHRVVLVSSPAVLGT